MDGTARDRDHAQTIGKNKFFLEFVAPFRDLGNNFRCFGRVAYYLR